VVDRLRKLYSDLCLHVSLLCCDCVHLLYPSQLDAYPLLRRVRRAVFHEYVPVTAVPRSGDRDGLIVTLVGAPWYLKGADLLVEVFLRILPDFPDARLRIIGHYPDRDVLLRLAKGSPQIEILQARPNDEILRLIGESAVFVLPSRCEGMGRVILEAMAAGVPVIGSDLGGIPTLIRDGENGFLMPFEDKAILEARLRALLSDPELRRRLGVKGFEMAHSEFRESIYCDRFVKMIETAVCRPAPKAIAA